VLVRILGCCLLLAASAVHAQEERLRWLLNDFPPFSEVDGATLPGQGITDALVRYLQQNLPQYRHEFEVASFARAYALMERGEPVCHPTTLKLPGREQSLLFSRPTLFLAAQQVLIRADRLQRVEPYLDAQERIDVRRLLADTQLVTAVSERRGYSPSINAALAGQGPQPHVLKAGVSFSAPFQQLQAGWIDYLFAYPVELGWYRHLHHGEPEVALRGLSIAGDAPFMLGYIACARGAWGERVIRDIDQQLLRAGPRPLWAMRIIEFTANEDREPYERALAEQQPFAAP
jgi:uncharacterized protein (TIGR02285 family)